VKNTRTCRWQLGVSGRLADAVRAGDAALTDKVGGRARRRAILILAAVLAVSSADQGAVAALAPQLEAAFHVDNVGIGLLATISSLIGAIATLPMGVLADQRSRTRLLTFSVLLWAVAEVAGGLSVSFLMLVLTRVALGAVTASAGPAVGSLTGDLFPMSERGRIYSFILTGELLGSGVGLLVAGNLGSAVSWRVGFILLASSMLRAGDAEMRPAGQAGESIGPRETSTLDEGRPPVEERESVFQKVQEQGVQPDEALVLRGDPSRMSLREAVRWVIRIRTNVLLIVSSCLGYFFFAGLRTFAVLFTRGRFGTGESVATLLTIVVGAASVAGLLAGGRIGDRLLARGRIDARLSVGAAGYLLAVVCLAPALLTTSLLVALPLVLAGAAALAAPNSPVDAARLDVVPSRMWGRTEAIRTLARSISEAAAPLAFGYVSLLLGGAQASGLGSGLNTKTGAVSAAAGRGLAYTFLVMLIPLAASAYFLHRARRTYPRDVASAAESERLTRDGSIRVSSRQ
jgi:predicted MFS family arabinose efflux permease